MSHILHMVALLVLGLSASAQTTWHVDANALPPGDGSSASPFVTIAEAVGNPALQPGDTVLVAPGVYAGDWSIFSVTVKSTSGPLSTTIEGFVLLDFAQLEGFTIVSQVGIDIQVHGRLTHCIVRPATPTAPTDGVRIGDGSEMTNCLVTGYQVALQMFPFSSSGGTFRNTILVSNDSFMNGFPQMGEFVNCSLPFQPGPNTEELSFLNTVSGDPGLWDLANLDFHLAPGSPCIGAGLGGTDIGPIPFDPSYAPGPTSYCEPTPTGDGCSATIAATGLCSPTSGQPFVVTASGVPPDKMGMLVYSLGAANSPFQGGTLCVATPVTRTTPMSSGPGQTPCSGAYAFDFNAHLQSPVGAQLQPGSIVYAQFHFRDPSSPGGFGIALSDALMFGIAL